MALPLAGRRVLVTRAAHQAGQLSQALSALGAEPVEVPVLEIRPPQSFDSLDRALRRLGSYDWLIFTSANTVRALVERSAALGISPGAEINTPALKERGLGTHSAGRPRGQRLPGGNGASPPEEGIHAKFPQVAAIGQATAAAARNAGFTVALVPPTYVAEALVASLAERAAGTKILLARAETARDLIPGALRAAGAVVDVVDAYRNVLPEAAPERLRAALAAGIDAATFTSSSSVTHLAGAAHAAGVAFPFAGVKAVSIGPITSATLREHGWDPAAEAHPSDIPGLTAAVEKLLAGS
jgi:uroporphyrinogen-III synthase